MEKNKKILIVAGEASGDLHASCLVEQIRKLNPRINFFGLGGEKLQNQGVELYYNIVELAVVGIVEVLKNLKKFHSIFNGLLKKIDEEKPDLAILVDYPGFNLRLAKELKKRNIPVIYYISPQIWAWGSKRIKDIKENVTHMITVFDFEEKLYKENGINASFVGHPLTKTIKINLTKDAFISKFGLDKDKLTISLLPGSRDKEVKTLLPIMLEAAKLINRALPHTQFTILRSTAVKEEIFNTIIKKHNPKACLISDMTHDGLNASDFAIVASGTATLETAIIGIPMVIVYKVSLLTWIFVRSVIKIPYIGLVNVVLQKNFIREFIQFDAKPKKIASYVCSILNSHAEITKIKKELSGIKSLLGQKDASFEAADIIYKYLNF